MKIKFTKLSLEAVPNRGGGEREERDRWLTTAHNVNSFDVVMKLEHGIVWAAWLACYLG